MRPEVIAFEDMLPVRAFIWNVERYPYHWHNALEILYVLEGQAEIAISGKAHLLKENNIAVINVNAPHRIDKSGGDNKLLIIQISPAFCAAIHPGYRNALFYCCSLYHEAQAPEKYEILKDYVVRLVCLLNESSGENSRLNVKNCLEELLFHLMESFDYLRFGPGVKAFKDKQTQRFKNIYAHIQKSPAERQSLLELAEVSGVSLQHLSYDIKDKFGFTFQELVYFGRCEQAARLLLSTNRMIFEIAPDCGFSDPKYLIRSFKSYYHCTPSEFRKMHWAETDTLASQVRFREVPLSSVLTIKNLKKFCNILNSSMCEKKPGDTMDSAI